MSSIINSLADPEVRSKFSGLIKSMLTLDELGLGALSFIMSGRDFMPEKGFRHARSNDPNSIVGIARKLMRRKDPKGLEFLRENNQGVLLNAGLQKRREVRRNGKVIARKASELSNDNSGIVSEVVKSRASNVGSAFRKISLNHVVDLGTLWTHFIRKKNENKGIVRRVRR